MSGRYLLVLALSALLTACGGGGSGGGKQEETLDYTHACEALSWPGGQFQALQRMRIDSVEGELADQVNNPAEDLYVEARYFDEPDAPFLPLPVFKHQDDDGEFLAVPAPLNIQDPYANANFELTLVAGSARCAGPVVEVSGIRPGAGDEIDDYILETEQALVNEASAFLGGTSYEDLLARRVDLTKRGVLPPQEVFGILIAVDALESFREVTANLDGVDRELLEAYIAHLDFIGSMQANATRAMSLPLSQPRSDNALRVLPSRAAVRQIIPDVIQRPVADRGQVIESRSVCSAIQGDPVDIPNALDLQRYMAYQNSAHESLSGASGAMREAAMAGIPLVSAIVGGPAAAAVGTGVSLLLYVEYTLNAYSRDTLPGKFDHLEINLSPGEDIPEDYEKVGWNKAMWSGAEATASSNGHNLTRAAIGALAQALGAGRYIKSLSSAAAATFGTKAANAGQRFAQSRVFQKIADLAENPEGCLQIAPASWKVDVSHKQWTSSEIRGEAVALGQREPAYQELDLQKIGSSYLIVRVKPEEFSGKTAQADRYISVLEQQLVWTPAAKHIDRPGSVHEFDIEVRNTARPELAPGIRLFDGVELVSGPTHLGDGVFKVGLKAPDDPDDYPATAEAIRTPIWDPMTDRVGEVVLFSERRIRIDPPIACVKKNGRLDMAAELSGFGAGGTVRWTVSGGGSIGSVNTTEGQSTARYQAPGVDGEAIVKVQADDDAAVFDTARISVGACDAQMHVWGALSVSADAGSDESRYSSKEDSGVFMEEPASPPEKPGQLWSGRREHFESLEEASDLIERVGYVSADAHGSLSLASDASGGLVYHHKASQLKDQCWEDPDDGEMNCSSATSGAGAVINYYFDLDQPMTIEISIEGECRSGMDGRIRLINVMGMISRYKGEAKEPVPMVNGPDFSNFINPMLFHDEDFIPGIVLGNSGSDPIAAMGEGCADGIYTYSRELDLVGPLEPGEEDLVIVHLAIASALSNLDSVQEGRPFGSYSGDGDFKYSIRVQQK